MSNEKKSLKDIRAFLQSKKDYIVGLKHGVHTVMARIIIAQICNL